MPMPGVHDVTCMPSGGAVTLKEVPGADARGVVTKVASATNWSRSLSSWHVHVFGPAALPSGRSATFFGPDGDTPLN